MMRPTLFLLTTTLIASTGCMAVPSAKAPKGGAVATGEPLAVVDDVKVWTTTSKEKVGEAVHKDADGNKVGSTDVYAEKTHVHTQKVWYLVQGPEQIPDEDFFRIAGDDQAVAATLQMRKDARRQNRNGKIAMGAGLVSMIAGFFVPQPIIRTVLLIGGGLSVSGGWYWAYAGAKKMEPESHAVQRSMAERAARQYNQQLGATGTNVGINLSGKF